MQTWKLGKELGRGGEAAIYAVQRQPKWVVKRFHQPPTAAMIEKWSALMLATNPAKGLVLPIEFWGSNPERVEGLVLPQIVGPQPLHQLYNPAARAAHFPKADHRTLVDAARQLCAVFAAAHEMGIVLGDVNPSNVLLDSTGQIQLIDLDSSQFTSPYGRSWPCDLGTPLFTPPEWHGKPLRGSIRTPESDAFGLAVLLFHLLQGGRHPFSGVPAGPNAPQRPEEAIRLKLYAYSPSIRALNPPPSAWDVNTWGTEVAALFEQAFLSDHRPSPMTWSQALNKVAQTLVACPKDRTHFFPRAHRSCPWCAVTFKPQPAPSTTGWAPVDFLTLERRLAAMEWHLQPLELPQLKAPSWTYSGMGWVIGWRSKKTNYALDEALDAARDELAKIENEWHVLANNLKRLEMDARQTAKLARKWHRLHAAREKLLVSYSQHPGASHSLESAEIEPGIVPRIGFASCAEMERFGVTTALDLHRNVLRLVPGIGTDRIRALMEWKQGLHLGQFLNGPYAITAGQRYQQAALRAQQRLEDHAENYKKTAESILSASMILQSKLNQLKETWKNNKLCS